MTIQYQASAAGISWMALCEALRGRAEMQQALLELSSTNTAVQLQMTKVSADDELNQLMDQANGQMWAAIGQITGAVAGAASSIGMYARQTNLLSKADALGKGVDTDIEMKELAPVAPHLDDVPLVGGSANVEGSLEAAPVKAQSVKKEDSEPKLTPAQQELQRSARFYDTHGQTLSNAATSLFNSAGAFANSTFISQQAARKADETLQTGLAGIMKAQNDMVSAAISSNDSYSSNTEQAITTIINVSAVRG